MGEAPTLPGGYLGRRRLECPSLIRAFTASALFAAAAVAGAIISNANAAERLRAQLADFGIEVSQDEREAASGPRFKADNWAEAGALLGGMTALRSLNLANAQVADLAPSRV